MIIIKIIIIIIIIIRRFIKCRSSAEAEGKGAVRVQVFASDKLKMYS